MMRADTQYFEVKEIENDPDDVNRLIDGGGWDLLRVALRSVEVEANQFTDIRIYVLGHREDARD